ncbi:hypothetical protein VUR80DRAFT_6728 [Thermomyces stellatus]
MPSTEPRLSLLVAFLLFHALVTAAIPTPISGAQIRKNESSASEGGFFAEFTRPREGDTLVTGSVAEVRWETLEWDGAAMLEVAKGDGEAGHFIYVDCECLFFSPLSRCKSTLQLGCAESFQGANRDANAPKMTSNTPSETMTGPFRRALNQAPIPSG